MEIQSAFNAGVQGFNNAQKEASDAASAIASQTAAIDEQVNSPENGEQEVQPNNANSRSDNTSLTQEAVNLKVAEFQAKASADVIQTADETLGTLLDVRV